jgi:hypothetical protein
MRRLEPTMMAGVVAVMLSAAPMALAAPVPVPREVLLIVRGLRPSDAWDQAAPNAVEAALNHLGLVVHRHDLATGLPDPVLSRQVRGVVTLIDSPAIPGPAAYAAWLGERARSGQSLVVLGDWGFATDSRNGAPTPAPLRMAIYKALGVTVDGTALDDPDRVRVDWRGPATDFERPWHDPVLQCVQIRSTDAANTVFLRLKRNDTQQTSDVGVVGPHGAALLGLDYLLHRNAYSGRAQWRVDPFWLFGKALGLDGLPRLDPTTLNGRRLFWARIDADDLSTLAAVRGRPFAAGLIRDRILRHTVLPTTIAVRPVDVAKQAVLIRSLLALPQVEGACMWGSGRTAPASATRADADRRALQRLQLLPGRPVPIFRFSEPVAPGALPVGESPVTWWSRANLPPDPRLPSYADQRQFAASDTGHAVINDPIASDAEFTNGWAGPPGGHAAASRAWTHWGTPRRTSAVAIVAHMTAGKYEASLRALEGLYHWAERAPLAPVFASRYVQSVFGFLSGEIMADGPDAWLVRHTGGCMTVRFDHEARVPDLSRSLGVAGFNKANGSLYVHLGGDSARIVLGPGVAGRPYLEEANAPLVDWQNDAHRLRGRFDAASPLVLILAGFAPGGQVRISGDVQGGRVADTEGRISLHGPAGRPSVEVTW